MIQLPCVGTFSTEEILYRFFINHDLHRPSHFENIANLKWFKGISQQYILELVLYESYKHSS